MKKFAFLTLYLDSDGALRAQSTDIEALIWLYELIGKNVAVQETIDRFQFSFELLIDIPSESKKLHTASNAVTEITWWLYYELCKKGWEPMGEGEFRKAEEAEEN